MTRIHSIVVVLAVLAFPSACGDDDTDGDDDGAGVTIELLEEQGGGPFTATGDAADDGVICASGTAQIIGAIDQETGGAPSEATMTLLADQEFTCDDGSGTFTLQEAQDMSDPQVIDDAIATGQPFPPEDWTVGAATGDYEGLQGSGTYIGQAIEPGSMTIQNTFTGVLSNG